MLHIYIVYALCACGAAYGLGAFFALGMQTVKGTPAAIKKLRGYRLKLVAVTE